VFGAVSGYAPRWLDEILMRLTEIFLSVPELLIIILLQAVIGKATIWSLAFVIGITSWTGIAKIVRTEVIQLKNSEYVLAARSMGGSFFYILIRHLTPNFISSIMFMVVMNVRGAIVAESTLSFMGLGLPLEIISWGSMLSLADQALLNGAWWIILIPGTFLVTTLMCVTNLGNYLRIRNNQGVRNL
jgi:peptide/nickel transport system permease protein